MNLNIYLIQIIKFFIFKLIFIICFLLSVFSYALSNNPFFIIINGDPSIVGYNIEHFTAYNYSTANSKWEEILIQIDEKNLHNDYVLDQGIPYTKDTDDKVFDLNDEMVIKVTDFKDCFNYNQIPQNILTQSLNLWRITIPDNNTNRCVLLVYSKIKIINNPNNETIKYDIHHQTIKTPVYNYIFNKQYPALLGKTYINDLMQSNFVRQPLITNSDFKIFFRTKWFLPNFMLSKEDFTSSIECWKIGPLRTIVAVGLQYKKLFSFIKLHFFSELIFYENSFEIPTVIEFPINAPKVLNNGSGIFYFASFNDFKNWKITTNLQSVFTQKELKKIFLAPNTFKTPLYALLQKNNKNIYIEVKVEDSILQTIFPPIIFYKEQSFANLFQWDWINSINFDIGMYIDFSKVKKNMYKFKLNLFILNQKELGIVIKNESHSRLVKIEQMIYKG